MDDELQTKISRLYERLGVVEERVCAALKRIDEQSQLTKSVNSLALSVEKLAYAQETMADKMSSMEKRVDAIEQKPGKRWEGIVEKALAALVGAFVTYLLTKGLPVS